jgi:hypothetical protein
MAEWITCRVQRAGAAEGGIVYLRLEGVKGEFPSRWFSANNGIKQEALATALTAITTQLHVDANIVARDEYSVVNRLYITRES